MNKSSKVREAPLLEDNLVEVGESSGRGRTRRGGVRESFPLLSRALFTYVPPLSVRRRRTTGESRGEPGEVETGGRPVIRPS